MMRRIAGLAVTATVVLILFYISQFWDFRLWQGGLFGIGWLRPQGDLVSQWLRGTPLATVDLLVWAVGSVLVLTFVEKGFARLWPQSHPPTDDTQG